MKKRMLTTAAVAGILAALATGDVFAAGRGNGGSRGMRNGTCITSQTTSGSTSATRPAGSQRRDGTFLTTGTTANGSTTRPGRGTGPMDGSCLTTATPAPTPAP